MHVVTSGALAANHIVLSGSAVPTGLGRGGARRGAGAPRHSAVPCSQEPGQEGAGKVRPCGSHACRAGRFCMGIWRPGPLLHSSAAHPNLGSKVVGTSVGPATHRRPWAQAGCSWFVCAAVLWHAYPHLVHHTVKPKQQASMMPGHPTPPLASAPPRATTCTRSTAAWAQPPFLSSECSQREWQGKA